MSFASATHLSSEDGSRWEGRVQPGWDIRGVANGGYLMAMIGRAMIGTAGGRRLVSMSAHFSRPASAGPVGVEVEAVRQGKGFSTLRAEMSDEEGSLVSALGTLTSHHGGSSWEAFGGGSPPELPPPEDCVRAVPSSTGSFPPPFVGKVVVMIHPDDIGPFEGKPSGLPQMRGWFRLGDDEPLDNLAVLLAADSFPPAIFNLDIPIGWTPTLQMTTHVRHPRPDRWLRCRFRTRYLTGDLVEEDGEMWDEPGRLVGQSRQLALVPRPDHV